MKFKYGLLVLLFFCSIASSEECDSPCKEKLITDYFKSLDKVFLAGSTEADINKLFELFHPEVKYQHFEYDANFNNAEWRAAFIGNLQRGAYKKQQNESIKVTTYIHGKSHSAVEYIYGRLEEGKGWIPNDEEKLLAIFGFKDDKIVLVREYW